MKNLIRNCLLLLIPVLSIAQQRLPGSITAALKNAATDSASYAISRQACSYFSETNRDSAIYYANKAASLAQKNNQLLPLAQALDFKAYQLTSAGHYADALATLLQSFALCNDPHSTDVNWFSTRKSTPENTRLLVLSFTHHVYGILMERTQNIEQEITHFKLAKQMGRQINFSRRTLYADMHLGITYAELGRLDSAAMFANEARTLITQLHDWQYLGNVLGTLGDVAAKRGQETNAKRYYYESIRSDIDHNNTADLALSYIKLTRLYLHAKQKDSSLCFAKKAQQALQMLGPNVGQQIDIGITYQNLYDSYKLRGEQDSSLKYAGLAVAAKDSINKNRLANLSAFQNLSLKEQLRLRDLEKEKVLYQGKVRNYAFLAGLSVVLVIALILYRNNRHKQKANKVLENTLVHLKTTQTQLIQSEKMASLGELTAGIAHEIQNPLNFVNNFSDVNREMIDELEQELKSGNIEEALAITGDLKDNEKKISHHGKRADGIVKGMLEHSRISTGQKEPTDLNKLADEYLRLAYHGLRAKDKSFNAEMINHFDQALPKVSIVSQDIGRVLLNLFNNAFYAANQKAKTVGADYQPMVEVRTTANDGQVVITVKDNGTGIPENIREKIMQPFFTTKPTGEGTGLGLSLSYDIVVKGHGGKISVDSKDGEGSEFTVTLPIS